MFYIPVHPRHGRCNLSSFSQRAVIPKRLQVTTGAANRPHLDRLLTGKTEPNPRLTGNLLYLLPRYAVAFRMRL